MRWRKRRELDLGKEIRAPLDLEAEQREDAGLPPWEARHASRRAFGNTILSREVTREMRGWVDPLAALRCE